jgi:hypothetical protein
MQWLSFESVPESGNIAATLYNVHTVPTEQHGIPGGDVAAT